MDNDSQVIKENDDVALKLDMRANWGNKYRTSKSFLWNLRKFLSMCVILNVS